MDDEFSQDYLYRFQLLQAFGLDQWDENVVNTIMDEIYNKIIDNIIFRELIETAKKNNEIVNILNTMYNEETDTDMLVFELLFKYEFFDLIHKCISEYLRDGRVKEETIKLFQLELNI